MSDRAAAIADLTRRVEALESATPIGSSPVELVEGLVVERINVTAPAGSEDAAAIGVATVRIRVFGTRKYSQPDGAYETTREIEATLALPGTTEAGTYAAAIRIPGRPWVCIAATCDPIIDGYDPTPPGEA